MLWSAQHHLWIHPFLLSTRLTFLDLPLPTNTAPWLVAFCILLFVCFIFIYLFFSLSLHSAAVLRHSLRKQMSKL